MSKPEVLNILVDNEYLNSSASLNPVIRWDYYASDSYAQTSYRVKVGTAKGKSNIIDTGIVVSSAHQYTFQPLGYGNTLKYGLKYYITVQVSNINGMSEICESYFFTSGDYWEEYVDNAMGWTIEFYYKMNASFSSIPSFNEDLYPHHDIEIKDGTASMSLEFFVDRFLVKTSEISTYYIDTTKFHLYRVACETNNVKVYIDGELALDIVGKNTVSTNAKQLKISSAPNGLPVASTWGSFSIDLDGDFPPDTLMNDCEVSSIFFDDEEVVDFLFDTDTKDKFFVAVNPTDISKSGKIYSIAKNAYREKYETKPIVGIEANKIMIDSLSNKWISTRDQIFEISGEKIGKYNYDINLTEEANLVSFSKVENCTGVRGIFNNFLRIDTTQENAGSVWYYETVKGTSNTWFANVDNSKGWVVYAKLRIANDQDASSESSGLIINDGVHEETIYFFEDRLRLSKANIISFHDFHSDFVDVMISGKEDDIFVFIKDGTIWKLLVDGTGTFIGKAQLYADCGAHSTAVLYGHHAYSVWHANKGSGWQIYLSEYNGSEWSPDKQLTFENGNRTNPDIFVDSSDMAHIVYQDSQFGNNEIVYAKYNGYSIYEKVRITDSVADSIKPKVVVDSSGNIYIAWLDNRLGNYHVYTARYSASEEKWYSSHYDETDIRISEFGKAYNASNLAMSAYGTEVGLVWSDNRNTAGNIYFSYYGTGGWVKEELVSNVLYGASNPDISVDSIGCHNIVWQDSRYGNDQIFYRKYNGSFSSSLRVSTTVGNSTNPSISIFSDADHDINILWLETLSNVDTIRMRRTVDGTFRNSDDEFTALSYGNLFSLDSVAFPLKKELQLIFSANNSEGYKTIYSSDIYVQKDDVDIFKDITADIDAVSNSKNTKAISFGNISSSSLSVSEWYSIKYYYTSLRMPSVIRSWNFSKIHDFFIDQERNLYVADDNGLEIYSMILSGSSLTQNATMEKASVQSPPDLKHIYTSKEGYIYVSSGSDLYYHYPLSSSFIDEDHEWLSIDIGSLMGKILCFAEDTITGKMWIGFEEGAVSFNPSDVFKNNTLGINYLNENIVSEVVTFAAVGYAINAFSFSEQYIWIATTEGIVKINRQNNSETVLDVSDGLMDQNITHIHNESDSVVWAIGERGLVKVEAENVTIYRGKTLSDYINAFDIDEDGNLWLANNLGLEFFALPNTHYLIDASDGLVSNSDLTDYKAYQILTDDILYSDFYHVVKINGIYRDSSIYCFDTKNNLIIFDNNLSSSDQVEFIYFNYVKMLFDLNDPSVLLEIVSNNPKRLTGLAYSSSEKEILASFTLDGDSYVYKFGSTGTPAEMYPFGSIIYDKTPPLGTVDITDQISASQVALEFNATDNVSGVESMVVSKYSNFTSDGITPLSPIPYTTSMNYDLGSTIGVGVNTHTFSGTTGNILHVYQRSINGVLQTDLYAGSSNIAQVYKFDKTDKTWSNVENLSADKVLCMTTYMGKMFVGTGDTGKLFVSLDGSNFSVLHQFSDSYVYSLFTGSDGKLYIGTGPSAKLYVYNNDIVSQLFDFNETSIYSMEEFSGFIYIATGEKGRVYRYNIANKSVEIAYDDIDTRILSMGVGRDYKSSSNTLYVGTYPNGKILRLVASRDIFVKSFESIYTHCYSIRKFPNITDGSTNDLYACINQRLLKLGSNSWSIVYIDSDNSNIKDVAVFNGEIFVITTTGIKTVALNVDKYVYVKFIDYAGNETILFDDNGDLKVRSITERLFDILTVSAIEGFSLKNRILVVDEASTITKTVVGNRPFLSADRIDEETAVYISEVFNGTNNLISWDKITYSGNIPTGTNIEIQVRTSAVESAIVNENWSEAIPSGQTINGLSGQYIQFKAILSSTVRGITPVLYNVTITSKSTFAVHYFTTNFTLTSNLESGILAANTVIPTGTEVIFGVTSGTSTDWNDYQVIEPNRVFYTNSDNSGSNIKIGVKFLSTTQDVAELHEFGIMFTTENGQLVKLNLNQS